MPSSDPTLLWWLRNDFLLTFGDTDPIAQWDDASGNARHASSTGAVQVRTGVQGGRPAIEVDAAAGEELSISSYSHSGVDYTLYVAGKLDADTAGMAWVDYEGLSRVTYQPDEGSAVRQYIQFTPLNFHTFGSNTLNFEIQTWRISTTVELYVNGSQLGVAGSLGTGATPNGALRLMAGNLPAKCGEMMLFQAAHDAAARARNETYLNNIFGVF